MLISRKCRRGFSIFHLQRILEFFMLQFSLCNFITFFQRSLQRCHSKYRKSPTTFSSHGFDITFSINLKAHSAKPRDVGFRPFSKIHKFLFLHFTFYYFLHENFSAHTLISIFHKYYRLS